MAFKSLATSGIINFAKYQNALVGNAAFDPASDFLIQEQILASAVSSVTFTSIPSTYKHLQIRSVSRSANASTSTFGIEMAFNGDTSANYSYHELKADGSSVSSYGEGSRSKVFFGATVGNSATVGNYASSICDILDYSDTSKYKTTRSLAGSSSGYLVVYSGNWRSTAAITSLTLNFSSNNFAIGSRFSLYGSNG